MFFIQQVVVGWKISTLVLKIQWLIYEYAMDKKKTVRWFIQSGPEFEHWIKFLFSVFYEPILRAEYTYQVAGIW